MLGGLGLLGVVEDFLVEFLALTETGELYLDVGGVAEGYHTLGEIDDLDGLAHIEDEDLSAVAHGACLKDELAGLGDEHEVADDIGMGDGDGAAFLDLLTEQGDDGAIGAEDIAEAGGDELGDGRAAIDLGKGGVGSALCNGFVEGLAVDLADTLGAAHDIGGVDGFVGGDHDELLGAILDGEVGDDMGAEDIVLDCHSGVVLHHGDMLISCGMEDIVGTVLGEELIHAGLVADGGDDGEGLDIGEAVGHHQSDIVHRGLGLIDEDHLTGMEEGDLVDHLATDRACSTGDEDDLVAELVGDGIHIDVDPVARKEVFDLDLMELVVLEVGILIEVLYLGHHLDLDIAGDEVVDELLTGAEVVGLPGADDEARDILHAHGVDEVFVVDEDGLAHEVLALHLDIGGDEALDDIFLAYVIADALGYGDASMACAIDEDAVGLLGEAEGIKEGLDDDSLEPEEEGAYEEDIDEGLDTDDGSQSMGEDDEGEPSECYTHEVGKEDTGEVNEAGVAYDA